MVMPAVIGKQGKEGKREPKPGPSLSSLRRKWWKPVLVAAAITSAVYLSSKKGDEKLPSYEQQVTSMQSLDVLQVGQTQIASEKMFVGVQRLKIELEGNPEEYSKSLVGYCAMIDDIAGGISALGVDVKDEKRLFAEFMKIFKARYWKTNADRQNDALYKSISDGWYDCDGSAIVLRDVAEKLGKRLTIYFAWKTAPGIQTGHSFAAGDEYAFETAYSQMFPVGEIPVRYSNIYGKAASTESALFSSYEEAALTLYSSGDYAGALSSYSRAIETNPSAPAYFGRGNCYLALKDYKSAESDFRRAMEMWPEFSPGFKGMGLLCQNTGRHSEAVGYYGKSLELFNEDASVHYYSALSYIALGDYSKARDALKQTLKLNPDQPNARLKLEQIENALN